MSEELIKRGPGRPFGSTNKPAEPEVVINDVKETISTFLDKIATAKGQGEESIETTPEIIAHYNRNGLNGAEYFIYNGIKVYPLGKKAEIEAKENEQLGQKIHGVQEGVVLNT